MGSDFWDKILLCTSSCPSTYYATQAGFKLMELLLTQSPHLSNALTLNWAPDRLKMVSFPSSKRLQFEETAHYFSCLNSWYCFSYPWCLVAPVKRFLWISEQFYLHNMFLFDLKLTRIFSGYMQPSSCDWWLIFWIFISKKQLSHIWT